jgi:hypothetical protein
VQVLVGEQRRIRLARVDSTENRLDRGCFTLSAEHLGLGVTLCLEDRGLPGALSFEDR